MWSVLLLACVMDRTGQSATEAYRKELAEHDRRVQELEMVSEDQGRRVTTLEEFNRARSEDEILKLETMEQLRQEVARLRGDVEVLQHDYQANTTSASSFQQDVDGRMLQLEGRAAALEKALGLKPGSGAAVSTPASTGTTGTTGTATTGTPTEKPSGDGKATTELGKSPPADKPLTPEETFALIAKHLQDGNGVAARAVAERFLRENPKHARVSEAWYRIAESYQNEGAYKDAAVTFQKVVDNYPDSSWAPWAMLRQGECFASLGKAKEAKLFWEEVIRLYPKSKAAKEAKAKLDGAK